MADHAGPPAPGATLPSGHETKPSPSPEIGPGGGAGARPERIGPYRILDLIGEGGMGTVYLAEQREPVHRRVAIKVIKLGMSTRQVLARFETERQALAMMDHPHVARVLDAGTMADGRQQMELVRRATKLTEEMVELDRTLLHAQGELIDALRGLERDDSQVDEVRPDARPPDGAPEQGDVT